MAEIFISYSQKDKGRVRMIAEGLEGQGFDVFWDPEIPPGETWDNVIARELKAAQCVIVAWSEASAESDWVKEEADFGKRMKALVPVQLDPTGPPLGFSRIQTANLTDWTGDPNHPEWRKVLDRVRHHGVDTSQAEPAPALQSREAGRLRDALYSGGGSTPSTVGSGGSGGSASASQAGFSQQSAATPTGQAAYQASASAAGFAPAANGGTKDPAATFDFTYTFLNAKGRLAKKPFWIGFAIYFAITFVTQMVDLAAPGAGGLVSLAMIYPGICLYGKRLHDFGMSAWVYGGFLLVSLVVILGIGGSMIASGAFEEEVIVMVAGLGFLLQFGFTLWVGLMATEPRENKHGPVPGAGGVAAAFS